MENGKDEVKTEEPSNDKTTEVKDEKPVADGEEKPTTEPEPSPELLEKIKDQVEFYFGDINMQRDKFLIEQTKLDDGWIPMSVMLNFKMLASLSKDVNVILKALENSDLMEVSEDKRKIRRSPKYPLPVYNEEYRKAQEARTVYMKGFPLQDMTIEKLKTFLKEFESFENIIMRKYQDKEKKLQFKGSIFVQFKTLEDAKAFMERESIKYGENELIRKWSATYAEEKAQEKEEIRKKRAEQKGKKNEQEKEEEEAQGDEETPEKDSGLPKGSVIHFTGVSGECAREDIKESLGQLDGSVAFVDFKKGDAEGWVRLYGENSAKPVVEKMKEGKLTVAGVEISCRVLEGEEETKYLAKAKEEMTNLRNKYNRGKSGRKGRGSQRGKKRQNQASRDDVPNKKVAVE